MRVKCESFALSVKVIKITVYKAFTQYGKYGHMAHFLWYQCNGTNQIVGWKTMAQMSYEEREIRFFQKNR